MQEKEGKQHVAWGKRAREGDENAPFHPLCDHMLDVAACFVALTAKGGRIREAMHATAKRVLDDRDIARLAAFVFLHDFGKANSGFQAKRWRTGAPRGWPLHAGHGVEARLALEMDEHLLAGLPLDEMSAWGGAAVDLLLASLGHHGRPVREPVGIDPHLWQPVFAADGREVYNPAATLRQIGDRLRRDLPRAFEPGGESLPNLPSFAHLFAGLVQLADWLGSSKQFFPYSEPGVERTFDEALRYATEAVERIGLDVTHLRAAMRNARITFESAFNVSSPRPVQAALGDTDLGPLLILESETGSGKTEAALWRFAKLFEAGKVDSLYFALPTRVAAVQVYERVRDFVRRLWPSDAPVVVRALAGYESADGSDMIALPDYEVLWSDNPDDIAASKRWAAESPKRFLAATIAVGTIDQALLAGLSVRHAHLRHAALSRSLLVVDEVHASDTYMSELLEHLLKAHLATGGHALLLSATLGSRQRVRFQNRAHPPCIEEACAVPYPALIDGARISKLGRSGAKKHVHWQTCRAIDDFAHVARIAVDAARQGARVLIVRNTVPSAIATQEAIESMVDDRAWLFDVNGVATLHHSRFSRQDRPRLDEEVEARIGKKRDGMKPCIVVGTQTLEQSLDLDADLLITDICPMDVLLQRIGRLHRHVRPASARPEAFREAHVWVLIPESGSFDAYLERPRHGLGRLHNGGGVYSDLRMIEATRRLIEARGEREIPRDNRKLVEHATHPDCLDAIAAEFGPAWQALSQQLDGSESAKLVIARLQALDYAASFEALAFPGNDERVATRLGAKDRLIRFDPPVRGPFGIDVREIAMRHHMLPDDLDPDAAPSDIALCHDGFAFSLGGARFTYDRFGVRKRRLA
ncbi:CRISPR-associated helicase/endonuclease Cas3 [Burkholderia sp. SFA1]|uniref:CRISPR-associated helicase Cas3' n=1 Tax=unclassified Caballeronia TaxID=2646786 RepID=UPI001F28C536|nr:MULTISPECIES: CRISPR-associated helicase Cas3' [unclassified Caballeronia]MCE4545285.1 CRISPR-associated helicase Cas3' [Caballeronia sp. PC1]MCE4570711.1 CRISPR-associated helicase Cas3' [Caballeronia sp. CLC5]BBP97839.1 CRISPR-associated helicase/endonuclease Cas3 [Burkholderia sp. SFA1]